MQVTFIVAPIALLVVVAVIVGLVMLVRALPSGSGPKVAVGVGVLLALGIFTLFFGYNSAVVMRPTMAVRQDSLAPRLISQDNGSPSNPRVLPPRIDLNNEGTVAPAASESALKESELAKPTPGTSAEKPNEKPAWLTQGTQTGNGVSQFPVSSELFSTASECHKDLDIRSPGLIAEEVRFLRGEPEAISLLPGEAQRLVTDTYTEEVTTSQGTWYKVHRLIKIDEQTWAMFRQRFQQLYLERRLVWLGLGLAGVMLVLAVVYLLLRRAPRVVDPTLNTFSTT